MQLVEKHIITKYHPFFTECDRVCYLSKNLYNAALYEIRQAFFKDKNYLNYNSIEKLMQQREDYKALPAKVAQQTLRVLDKNFVSFFNALKTYQTQPEKFLARPKITQYKDKVKGRNIAIYTIQAVSSKKLKKGIVKLSGTSIELPTKVNSSDICQVRIVPNSIYYTIEVVYEVPEVVPWADNGRMASIDIGLNNLAVLTTNKDIKPLIINGKPLKSINQYYNKNRAKLQSYVGDKGKSKRLEELTHKRNNKVNNYLHNASRFIVNQLVSNHITTLVIGKNDQWKQDINIGKRNNQNFVSIPHAIFIKQLEYKCQLVGITVKLQEESYTSKCSFLDNEPIKKHENYQGKRIKRGLFKAADGTLINADQNGSLNILRKAFPNAFADGIQGVVVRPVRVNPYKIAV